MQMAVDGAALVEASIDLANGAREQINKIPGLYCFGTEKIGNPGVFDLDVTKVTVTVKGLGLTGAEVEKILRHEYKVQAELSDLYNVLFWITLGDGQYEVDRLVGALRAMAKKHKRPDKLDSAKSRIDLVYPAPPQGMVSPREALFGKTCVVPFPDSVGRVCAEIITFYPPGIPVLCPGEVIAQDTIDYCQALTQGGMHISGPEDCTLRTIKVVDLPLRIGEQDG